MRKTEIVQKTKVKDKNGSGRSGLFFVVSNYAWSADRFLTRPGHGVEVVDGSVFVRVDEKVVPIPESMIEVAKRKDLVEGSIRWNLMKKWFQIQIWEYFLVAILVAVCVQCWSLFPSYVDTVCIVSIWIISVFRLRIPLSPKPFAIHIGIMSLTE